MNVLFLTIGRFDSIEAHSIYTDLLREFRDNGHHVFVVSQRERRYELPTELVEEDGASILKVCIGNITKCGIIEKGISTVFIEQQYKNAIKKYLPSVKFNLILYSTPPITLAGVVKYFKKRDNAKTFLLLKDIFPQNAVDIGLMKKSGLEGLLYKYFRRKEEELYAISDHIGCMSQANVDYILKHNPEVPAEKVEICPNSIEPVDMSLSEEEKRQMRIKYGLPLDKKIFVYGGNLGKPQGIPFLINCLKSQKKNKDVFFFIAGDGTEYGKIEEFISNEQPENVKLMKRLRKEDYDQMIASCDVGMVFLDYRFTIPNFPSRLLSYMQAKLPVLAVTDPNTDIGQVITEGGFGWWCASDSVENFADNIKQITENPNLNKMQEKSFNYLKENYSVSDSYLIINDFINKNAM